MGLLENPSVANVIREHKCDGGGLGIKRQQASEFSHATQVTSRGRSFRTLVRWPGQEDPSPLEVNEMPLESGWGGSSSFVLTFLTLGKWRPGVPFFFRCCILEAETRFSLDNEPVDPESLDFTGFKMIRNNIFVILNFPRLNYSVILARTTLAARTTSELQWLGTKEVDLERCTRTLLVSDGCSVQPLESHPGMWNRGGGKLHVSS